MRAADAALLIVTLMLVWSFYRAHKDREFALNLFDLVMDGGRISKMAFAFMLTLSVTSWIMVRLTLDGKLTEGYFTAYGIMWIAPLVAKLFSTPPPAGTTTTVDTGASKTVVQTIDPPPKGKGK